MSRPGVASRRIRVTASRCNRNRVLLNAGIDVDWQAELSPGRLYENVVAVLNTQSLRSCGMKLCNSLPCDFSDGNLLVNGDARILTIGV